MKTKPESFSLANKVYIIFFSVTFLISQILGIANFTTLIIDFHKQCFIPNKKIMV